MIKIHKEVYGHGPVIVMIHGWAMHTGIWRKFAQELSKNHQVVCLDLPGHGLSESVEPYDLDMITQVLVKKIPDRSFAVLGWSLGATVALNMAKQFPERVDSLILMAGNAHFINTEDWPGMSLVLLDDFAAMLQLNCQATLLRFLGLQVNGLVNGKALLKDIKQQINACEPPSENVLKSGLDILKTADLRESLMALTCSVNIIQGDKDTLIPSQAGVCMQELQPKCELNTILGAGHVPFLSHPSTVLEILNRFL